MEEINKREYVLVDIYDENEFDFGIVYHYMSWEDDKYLLNNQIIIENSDHIKMIEDYLGYNDPILYDRIYENNFKTLTKLKTYKFTEEEKEEVYQYAVDRLTKTFEDIDRDILLSRLRTKGEIYLVKNKEKFQKKDLAGFYQPYYNDVYLTEKKNDNSLHELVHKISGKKMGFTTRKRGFVEAGTELIVEKTRNTTKTNRLQIGFGVKGIEYPKMTQECVYIENVALLRQMEYIMEKSSHTSILNGDFNFFKEFKKEYGNRAFNVICHSMNRLADLGRKRV